MKKLATTVSFILLLLAACTAPAPVADPNPPAPVVATPTAADEPAPTAAPEPDVVAGLMTIAATAVGFEAPSHLAAGWTTVTLNNESDGMRQAALFRFEEGKTMGDLAAAMQSGPPGPPSFLTAIGGVAGVTPGQSGSVMVNLSPGDYVMLDPVPDSEGVPGVAKGYILPFTVVATETAEPAPSTDLTLDMADYAFVFDHTELSAGEQLLHVTNSGPQEAHEVVVIRLNEGATMQDFLAATAPDAPPGPPPGIVVAGLSGLAIGEEAYISVEIEEGVNYGLICFMPSSHHQGTPHFALGMVSEFALHGD